MFKRLKKTSLGTFTVKPVDGSPAFTVAFRGDCSVLEAALATGIKIPHSCGGMGSCGTCRVEVLSSVDTLEERNEIELEMADARGFRPEERLACQLLASHGLQVSLTGTCDDDQA